jgi:hypothetical protein
MRVKLRCANCGRKLRREPTWISGVPFGPKCAFLFVGAKPKRSAVQRRDERQRELFEAAQ